MECHKYEFAAPWDTVEGRSQRLPGDQRETFEVAMNQLGTSSDTDDSYDNDSESSSYPETDLEDWSSNASDVEDDDDDAATFSDTTDDGWTDRLTDESLSEDSSASDDQCG